MPRGTAVAFAACFDFCFWYLASRTFTPSVHSQTGHPPATTVHRDDRTCDFTQRASVRRGPLVRRKSPIHAREAQSLAKIMRHEAVFTPTVDDILVAYRMHNRQPNDVWKLYLMGGVGVAAVFGVAAIVMDFLVIGVVGVVVGTTAFGAPLLLELNIRRFAKKLKPEEVRYAFSEDGVEFSTRLAQVKHTWDLITKASLDDRGILLYTGPLSYSFVPARAFVSGYFPRQELKALLFSKLKNT